MRCDEMNHNIAASMDAEYILPTYGRCDLAAKVGKGATLTDLDGKEYIDFTSGIGVNALGWCNDEWIKSVEEQLHSFQHLSNYYISPVTAEVAKVLVEASGLKKVFFANSGAEANEGAIKTARKYSFDKYGEGRSTIVTLKQSFHGRTVTTLAATGQDVFHNFFYPFTEGFKYAPLNDIDALNEALTDDVCAIMAEPIQGEGGVNIMTDEFAAYLRKAANERDILIIFDEVQTGIGRTGKVFAYQNFTNDFKPDILSLAKGLAGGLPIGAFMVGEKCLNTLTAGMHGSTFGGNPVSAAGAKAVLNKVTNEDFLSEVVRKGEYIKKRIEEEKLECVREIRMRGLMIGIAIDGNPKDVLHRAFDIGLLVLTAGKDVVRLLPPLNISDDELKNGCDKLIKALR